MKKICFTVWITVFAFWGGAQTRPHHGIGVSLGWQNFKFLDRHTSPLAYGTNSLFPSVGLFYNKVTDASSFNIRVSGSKGTINPGRFGVRSYKALWSNRDSFQYTLASQFVHAHIEATYLRKIHSLSGNGWDYRAGATISEEAYYGDEIANAPWLLNVADVAPAVQVSYLPGAKHSIGIRMDLSVFGLVTRPVYALFPKSNKDKNVPAYFKQGTHATSVKSFQKFNFGVVYQYQLARHFAVGVDYRFKWMHYTQPKDIRAVDKNFEITFSYTY